MVCLLLERNYVTIIEWNQIYVKISHTVVYFYAGFTVSKQIKFPCENKKKLPLSLDYNQDVADTLLLYFKKTMVYPNLLEVCFTTSMIRLFLTF